jgi:hypothetical protein
MVNAVYADDLQRAIENARATCSSQGSTSAACAVSWDIVEELQAAIAHQRVKQSTHSSLIDYCTNNPDAVECRLYDV